MPGKLKPKPLSDLDLVILTAAAGRQDRCALPWPSGLAVNGDALARVVHSLLRRRLLAEVPTAKKPLIWRVYGKGTRVTLIMTDAGLSALASSNSKVVAKLDAKPAVTKRDTILALLRSREGATVAEMMAATGWQAHSIRGFLSGTLARKLGHHVRSVKAEGMERRYHVET